MSEVSEPMEVKTTICDSLSYYTSCIYRMEEMTRCFYFFQGTDINSGVLRGIDMLIKDRQEKKLPERSIDMIILLTDGMPNSGKYAKCDHMGLCRSIYTLSTFFFF